MKSSLSAAHRRSLTATLLGVALLLSVPGSGWPAVAAQADGRSATAAKPTTTPTPPSTPTPSPELTPTPTPSPELTSTPTPTLSQTPPPVPTSTTDLTTSPVPELTAAPMPIASPAPTTLELRPTPVATTRGATTITAAAASDVGVRDFSYGSSASAPTAEKPQSKLWFNDGSWWGILWSRTNKDYEVYRFNWSTDTWTSSGVLVDARNRSRADVLWDGSHLFVVTHQKEGTTGGDLGVKVLRYSYNANSKIYSLDAGFPVIVATGAIEAGVLDKDTTGTLWVTYTYTNGGGGRSVYVTHSTINDTTWTTPYVVPVSGANNLSSDDISALVAYDGRIGVMWSNQSAHTMYFASHADGAADNAWSLNPALQGPNYADDHINLKSLQADASGKVWAAVKTSLNDVEPPTSSQPLILLLILDDTGSWQRRTFGRVSDNHTRPIVLIDDENREVYVFAVAPCCSGGVIYYKQTSMDNPSFPSGVGTPFIQLSTDPVMTNPTSTKQTLNSTTGLLVEAADDHSRFYAHNKLTLPAVDNTAPDTTIDAGPSGTVGSASATFAFSASETGSTFGCTLDGGSLTACTSPTTYSGLADGSHTFTVRATDPAGNTDPTPASRTWTVDLLAGTTLFSDGFESGSFSAWTIVGTGGDGTAIVQNSTVKTGAFAAQLSETSNTGSFAYVRKTLASNRTDLTVAGDFRVLAEGASGGNVPLIRVFDAASNRLVSLYRLNGSANRIGLSYGGAFFTTSGTLALNTWGRVSLRVVVGGTGSSTIEVRLNGTLIYLTTTASFTAGVRSLQIGNETAKQAGTIVADAIEAVDSTPQPPP
jgi:hypothetical protein